MVSLNDSSTKLHNRHNCSQTFAQQLGYLHRHGFPKLNTTVPFKAFLYTKRLKRKYRQEFYVMDVFTSRTGKRNQSASISCVLYGQYAYISVVLRKLFEPAIINFVPSPRPKNQERGLVTLANFLKYAESAYYVTIT